MNDVIKMSAESACKVCGKESPVWSWTDTHGVAQCYRCGTPYKIYHYEGEGADSKRVDKAPEIAVKVEWIPLLREYWSAHHRHIPSGFSFSRSHELATDADVAAFNKWAAENKHRANTEPV